jgi:anionic cell wall polymer biosynthesis LytR-Cps2A-Psr (LCP) family protein
MQNLVDTINSQFQLSIDHYMTIGCNDISNVVDALGGLPCYVPQSVNAPGHYGYDPRKPTIKKGQHTLTGKEAEWLVRDRHSYAEADIGRQKMQRVFLAAMVNRAKTIGISDCLKLLPEIWGNFKTDYTIDEIKELAKSAINIPNENIKSFMVPGESATIYEPSPGAWDYDHYSIYSIHKRETAELLNQYFRPAGTAIPVESLGITEVVTEGNYQVDSDTIGQSFAEIDSQATG